MKILAISHEFPPIGGGGANAAYYLTKGFVDKGHEVTLITSNYKNMKSYEKINGVSVIRVNSKRKYKEHCSFYEMLSFILKACPIANKVERKEHYDICLIFFGIPSGPLGYMLKKRYRLPYVVRFGGGDIPGFQKRFTKVYKVIAPLVKIIWKNADGLVANSSGLRKFAYDFYNKKQVDIITNGIDCNIFIPKYRNNKKIQILFVSRLIERKGLQFILPQMKWIQERCNTEIELVIVGDGPYKSTLQGLVKKYRIEDIVVFEGQKDKKELVPYYQTADIFIFPSEREGMPNVVLEAMACGLPIIMTPCEGSEELIQKNGYIVSVEEFAEKIVTLCNDELLRVQLGRESRINIEENFLWEKVVDKYIDLFKSVIKKVNI